MGNTIRRFFSACYLENKHKNPRGGALSPKRNNWDSDGESITEPLITPSVFEYKHLFEATDGFSLECLVGEGACGCVFVGNVHIPSLGTSRKCAVKKLKPESFQEHKEFMNEVLILGRLNHRSLVKLFGYCVHEGSGLLVLEFIENGSLEKHLFGPFVDDVLPLSLNSRLKICLQVARGMTYLHHHGVIHRDLKATNILLDKKFNAKIADFGISKLANEGETHISTRILGTKGYVDPDYMVTGHVTKRTDVYAFGVLLLEIITGQSAAFPYKANRQTILTDWAKPFLKKEGLRPDMGSLMDPYLGDQLVSVESRKKVEFLAIIARKCLGPARDRPSMKEIAETLLLLVNG